VVGEDGLDAVFAVADDETTRAEMASWTALTAAAEVASARASAAARSSAETVSSAGRSVFRMADVAALVTEVIAAERAALS
jgi:flagellar hook-length control protein FliK